MGKRRTRKDKVKARHTFNLSWVPEAGVKGQFNSEADKLMPKPVRAEMAMSKAKDAPFTSLKRDILKSLIVASLILALEVVIYLAWSK